MSDDILLNGELLKGDKNCFRYFYPDYYQLNEVDFARIMADDPDKGAH